MLTVPVILLRHAASAAGSEPHAAAAPCQASCQFCAIKLTLLELISSQGRVIRATTAIATADLVKLKILGFRLTSALAAGTALAARLVVMVARTRPEKDSSEHTQRDRPAHGV